MKDIDHTLAEQMQINEREIEQRKALLNFTNDDAEILATHKHFIVEHVDTIVDHFYEQQIKISDIALLIGDAETLRLLRSAMRRYILELFDGHYDSAYVNRRLRIGKVHKRIGVPPKLYISAIWSLQFILKAAINDHIRPTSPDDALKLKSALDKLMALDTEFVFDTYIASLLSEVAAAKDQLEHYVTSLEEIVNQRTQELEELSRKDTLTGLFNQRCFYEYLRRELASAARYNDTLCLAYIDLNKFKELNDSEGHMAGDELLSMIGSTILRSIRVTDIPCRYGGDEFAIVMPRTNLEDAQIVCERIISVLEKEDAHGVSLSIGIISTGPEKFHDIEFLIKGADKLMYTSKKKAHKDGDSQITIAG